MTSPDEHRGERPSRQAETPGAAGRGAGLPGGQPTYSRPSEGRRGIWELVKYLNLVGGSFAARIRF